jgi:hypothetical protein
MAMRDNYTEIVDGKRVWNQRSLDYLQSTADLPWQIYNKVISPALEEAGFVTKAPHYLEEESVVGCFGWKKESLELIFLIPEGGAWVLIGEDKVYVTQSHFPALWASIRHFWKSSQSSRG